MLCARGRCAREVVVSDSDALLGDAMRAHPEDATIQRAGISCLCLLANVAENLPSMKVREGHPRCVVREVQCSCFVRYIKYSVTCGPGL